MPVIRQLLVLAISTMLALPASAQVSVDMNALDQVQGQPAQGQAPAPPATRAQTATGSTSDHQVRRPVQHPRPEARATHPAAKPAQTTAKPPAAAVANAPAPTLPTGPPPEVRLAPLTPAPPIQAQPHPEAPPTSKDAGTDVLSVGDGLRITFVPGHSDITPDTEDVLHRFARTVPNTTGTTIDVRSYASGSPDDISSSRRMSLSRSLAVRAALIGGGVPSTHIFVRALGPNAGDGPADRVDILVNRQTQDNPQPARAPAPPSPPATAPTASP